MKKKNKVVLVLAPHPDDETLGCGGTLLNHRERGDELHWLIVTKMTKRNYSREQIIVRASEIKEVAQQYSFSELHNLNFEAASLNSENLGNLISAVSKVIQKIKPAIVYCPFYGDVHTDHYWVYRAVIACVKSFRAPSIEKIMCYETLSETDFGATNQSGQFFPQVFIDVSSQINKKIEIMKLYKSEIHEGAGPRSVKTIESLASVRGAVAGVASAEAFQLLREIIK